jgi:hypothetical protein
MDDTKSVLLSALSLAAQSHLDDALRARYHRDTVAVNAAICHMHAAQRLAVLIENGELKLCENFEPRHTEDFWNNNQGKDLLGKVFNVKKV